MNHAINKLAQRYSHAVLTREQQMKVSGGASIHCSFSIDGNVSFSGPCASTNIYLCMQNAGLEASRLSSASGYRVDYRCEQGV